MTNSDPVVRQGNLAVNGAQLPVSQSAAVCGFDVIPRTAAISGDGGVTTLTLASTSTGCPWTATADVPWITIKAPATGSGSATITLQVAANNGTARTGTITAGDVSMVVSQESIACAYALQPASQAIGTAGGAGVPISVSTSPGCLWTVTNSAPWITVTTGAGGNGPGTIAFTVAANPGPDRTGVLTVAGRTFTLTQSGAGTGPLPPANCSYAISSSSQTVAAAGGPGTPVQVTTATGCAWTATSAASWITLTSGVSGSGSGTVAFTVAANPGPGRSGTLTIAGRALTVTQAAAPCTYQISPGSQSVGAAGGIGTAIAVSTATGCAWTATSAASWITITSGNSGSGGGTVAFTVAANSGPGRSGTLTIAGQIFTVTQAAAPCTYAIAPTAQTFGKKAENGTVVVTTSPGCAWTATSAVSWLSITGAASGSGNGTVHFNAEANETREDRVGTLNVAGQTFTVTQRK